MFELTQYASPLRVSPLAFAALACPSSQRFDVEKVKEEVLIELQKEWELVLSSESEASTASCLHKTSPQTKWQSYRELMTLLELSEWKVTNKMLAMVEAWIPRLNSSANIEDIFCTMVDCISRSTKTDLASMSNLQAVHIRAYQQKLVGQDHQARGISLTGTDFEGCEIRGLRTKLFQPRTKRISNKSPKRYATQPTCLLKPAYFSFVYLRNFP